MEIVKVDPGDEAALAAWHAALSEGLAAGREWDTSWTLPELAVSLRGPVHAKRWEAYAARDGQRTVGGLLVVLPLRDNLKLLMFEFGVPPAERGRGVGSALYEHVVALAHAEERSSLLVEVTESYQGKESTGGARFAERRGFTCRSRDLHRVLELPVDGARLGELARQAAAHHGDYRLRSWSGPCPDDLLDGYVALKRRFMSEVPLGDMDYEPEQWDAARVRADEERQRGQQRTTYTTVAIAPDGALAGHTVLVVPGHDPGKVFQDDTLVLPPHRGHRLGLALKVANLRAVQRAHPDRRVLHTWNAEANGPMVAVNDAMGFRPVERLGEYQRDL